MGSFPVEAVEETVGDTCGWVYEAVVKRKAWEGNGQDEFTDEEVDRLIGGEVGWLISEGGSRSRASRARKDLGWGAKVEGLWESLDEEVGYWVRKEGYLVEVEIELEA
ncbi:MAG: hypothetical protein LQ347_004561 [Umbilicaria vellea]|nr:MAG: hypothetical protein LQ347_004561 [Umbilicaria vellea]